MSLSQLKQMQLASVLIYLFQKQTNTVPSHPTVISSGVFYDEIQIIFGTVYIPNPFNWIETSDLPALLGLNQPCSLYL